MSILFPFVWGYRTLIFTVVVLNKLKDVNSSELSRVWVFLQSAMGSGSQERKVYSTHPVQILPAFVPERSRNILHRLAFTVRVRLLVRVYSYLSLIP